MINLKNLVKEITSIIEDNDIEMDIYYWGGHGNKIKIPSTGNLRYGRLKQNVKSDNYINQISEALYDNIEETISSSFINLWHYIAEYYEDEITSAASDSSLKFSGQMTAIEIMSMMNDVCIDIS